MKTVLLFLLIFPVVSFRSKQDRLKFFEANNCDPNCTFFDGNLTIETVDYFPTECTTVCSDLFIGSGNNLTEEQVESTFKNLKHLVGTLQVIGTKFVRGTFLAGLESIETGDYDITTIAGNWKMMELDLSNLTSINCTEFKIVGNPKMEKLKMPNLKTLTSRPTWSAQVTIDEQAPNFCITFDQMEQFLSIDDGDFRKVYANYCTPTASDKICTELTIREGCTRLFGNLRITKNFTDFENLKSIEVIFGRLFVGSTDLKNLDLLKNLRYIAPLGWNSGESVYANVRNNAVLISNNSMLIDYYLPNLKRIHSDSMYEAVIVQYNNEALRNNLKSCRKMADALWGYGGVRVDQTDCGTIEYWEEKHNQERNNRIIRIAIGVGVLAFLISFGILLNLYKAKKEQHYTVSYHK